MKRFEELMCVEQSLGNLETFNFLRQEVKRGRLVCFFGAGLSVIPQYRNWGYPFGWVIEKLNTYITDAKKGLSSEHEDCRHLKEAEEELATAQESFKAEQYLQTGNTLQNIIVQIQSTLNRCGLGASQNFTSFNQACRMAFREVDINKISVQKFISPYRIPAIYFLPFLGVRLLTTNVDESFEKACIDLKVHNKWHVNIVDLNTNNHDWRRYAESIFYIHGHVSQQETLIMSKSSYNRMYPLQPKQCNGARQILRDVAEQDSVLFVGASLQNDATVKIINQDKRVENNNILTNGRRFVVIVQKKRGEHKIEICDTPQVCPCDLILYDEGKHEDISTLLLQLIRETANNWSNCSWQEPVSREIEADIPEDLKTSISKF